VDRTGAARRLATPGGRPFDLKCPAMTQPWLLVRFAGRRGCWCVLLVGASAAKAAVRASHRGKRRALRQKESAAKWGRCGASETRTGNEGIGGWGFPVRFE
jgi:hypothetical protein